MVLGSVTLESHHAGSSPAGLVCCAILLRLLVYAADEETSIDSQQMPSDEAGRIGGQKDGSSDKLLQVAEAAHGSAHEEFFAPRGAVQQRRVEVSTKQPRGNG